MTRTRAVAGPARLTSAAAAVAASLLALPAAAQQDTWMAKGWFIGIEAVGSSLSFAGGTQKLEYGGGVGGTVGASVSDRLSVRFHFDKAGLFTPDSSDRYALRQADVLGRYTFVGPLAPVHPFLTAGLTAHSATGKTYEGTPGSYAFSGLAATVGGGAQVVLPGHLTLDLTILFTDGGFSSVHRNGATLPSVATTSVRAHAGIRYYARRNQ